jgi:two-component system, chemotaxis family, protein-glutamate methylesterase/glutaminase
MKSEDLKVMVVDDTVVYRSILTDVVEKISGVHVIGTAPNGKIALDKLSRASVDLVLLDVEMPVMGGLETLDALQRDHPGTGVIMVSGTNRNAADITMKALEKGALDFVPKPAGADAQASRNELVAQLTPLVRLFITKRNLGLARQVKQPLAADTKPVATQRKAARPSVVRKPPSAPSPRARVAPRPKRFDVLAIGVSTGGPNALAEVIPKLPSDLGIPVLLVQHMPPLFTKSLADSLAKKSSLPVREAASGETIEANIVLIAPGGQHMVARRKPGANGDAAHCVGLNDNPPENSCRPSVDVLFRSIAAHYGANILAVIMTGMGADGCEGVKAMKRRGCYCLTQSEETCVVYGMPLTVDEANLSDESVPLDKLAERIVSLVRRPVTG